MKTQTCTLAFLVLVGGGAKIGHGQETRKEEPK